VTETYLGDGLYASDDGYMITLRAPREDGDHWVALEPGIVEALLSFIERARDCKITVEHVPAPPLNSREDAPE
jgi:hypothetical protein